MKENQPPPVSAMNGDGHGAPEPDLQAARFATRRPSAHRVHRVHEARAEPHAHHVRRVHEARSEPRVRGEGALRRLEHLLLALTRWVRAAIPDPLNPFAQLGAIANTTFAIALVTGILLLFWYVPSVERAYSSVLDMEASAYSAGLTRSLHRYSAAACMLFVLLHAFQMLAARKVGPARRLGWVSGVAMAGLIWFEGWTGYWLVWDEPARQVALATAALLDVLPIFPEPIARSFLTDDSVNSLFFFVVFFIHMLIPLAVGIALWIHLLRLNTVRMFTERRLTAAIVLALSATSLLFPAEAAGPARMAVAPSDIAIDGFYLLPLYVADHLQAGLIWVLFLVAAVVVIGAPWWLVPRRPEPAFVKQERCNGCTLCYEDCPYNAISMVPSEGGRFAEVAEVDPSKCVACGVCVGACDSNAIDLPSFPAADVRRWLNRGAADWRDDQHVAFICANSAGAALELNERGESEDLPGYRIVPVPCTGWVHMLTVERALRRGAPGALLVGCGANPACRIGDRWAAERLAGSRQPERRRDRVADDQVRHVSFDQSDRGKLFAAAEAFRAGRSPVARRQIIRRVGESALLAALLCAIVVGATRLAYTAADADASELIVSFKHPGELVETRPGAASDQTDLLPHMRSQGSIERERVPVRLFVSIDGRDVLDRLYAPGGLFGDGASTAFERLPVHEGRHRIEVRIADSADPDVWTFEAVRELDFEAGTRRVVLFDRATSFRFY